MYFPKLVFLLTISLPSLGSILLVPENHSSIQSGLNNAQVGDSILVSSGVYTENLIWPEITDIVLMSVNGADVTTIDGNNSGSVISFSYPNIDTTSILQGFTIRNGLSDLGGGIYISGCSPQIQQNIIEGNSASSAGGGLYCTNSQTIIDNNFIQYNVTEFQSNTTQIDMTNGGGICFTGNSIGQAIISNNTITNNYSTDYGGGITCTRNALISGNQITSNTSGWFGGGLYHLGSSTVLVDNLISQNSSLWGAGITLQGGYLTITNCEILENNGDGLHLYYGTLQADTSSFSNNTGDGIGAGAGELLNSDNYTISATVSHCNITGNAVFGIRNSLDWLTINAILNWWGDSTGPGGLGTGYGDHVSRFVLYDPWLTSAGINSKNSNEQRVNSLTICPSNPVPSTTLVQVAGNGHGKVSVFDLSGRMISTLFDGQLSASNTTVEWNTTTIKPGIYFIVLSCDDSNISCAAIKL